MAKSPEVTISLKRLEELFFKSNPVCDVIPLRVRVSFSSLEKEEVKDLEEFANAEEGAIERWLLVPDRIPLGSLSFVLEKAFGLLPEPASNTFTMGEEDWRRLVPNMGVFLKECGRLFDNPMDVGYYSSMADVSISSKLWIAPLLVSMMVPVDFDYDVAQEEVERQFAPLRKSGVDMDGVHYSLDDAPTDLEFFYDKVTDTENFGLTDGLCPDLVLRDVLQVQGRKLHDLKDLRKGKRIANPFSKKTAKPFVHTLHMLRFDEEDFVAYDFEITRPKDVYSLIEDGYLSAEDYLESIQYVLKNGMPDCICKKGYDLFGPDPEFYHEFIMQIHGPEAEAYLQEASAAGWKEPYMDLKKVLR